MSVGETAEVAMVLEKSALERRGIPENGLPVWDTLPLWAKLPVPPALPKNAFVLTTTDLCAKIRAPSEDHQFDLTDPELHRFTNEYQSMHDPHLKYHLTRPLMQYRLFRGGYITSEGKVLCSLREYNEYRRYLRQQQWQTQVLDTRKQDEQLLRDINKQKQQFSGNGLCLNRAQKAKEVGKRVQHRLELDKERYSRIVDEEDARREKIRISRLRRSNEIERKRQDDEVKRHAVLKRKVDEERRKKLMVYAKLTNDEQTRRARMEQRRRWKEYENTKKLDEEWEDRKRQQNIVIRANHERHEQEVEHQIQWVHEYASYMASLQKRMEERLLQMQADARIQRLHNRENYAIKLQKTLRQQRSRKRAERMRAKQMESPLQSNWDWTRSLALDTSSREQNDKRIKTGAEDIELKRKYSIPELGLFDLRGAKFEQHAIDDGQDVTSPSQADLGDLRDANFKKRLYGRLLNDPKHGTTNVDKLLEYICLKYRGADMERITRAIRVNALVDKPELGLEAGMFPQQGKVPDELSADKMGHVPILKQIAVKASDETFGTSPVSYMTQPFDSSLNEAMSKYTDLEEVATVLVGMTITAATSIVHPASVISTGSTPVDVSSSTGRLRSPYRDTAVHMSLLGISDRHGDEERRSSLQNAENALGVVCSSDHGPMSRVNLCDSIVLTRNKLPLGPSYGGGGLHSIEDLINTLTDTLADVRDGRMDPEKIERLRGLATDILESAAVLANGVEDFADEHELLLQRRSSLLIEALISDTMDQLMQDVKENALTKTSSRLVADLVNYTLNEALDDSMRIGSDKLARIDAILVEKFITNNLHDALAASRQGRPTAESMLLQMYVRQAIDKVKVELARPGSEIEANVNDLASAIIRSKESVQEQAPTPPREPSVSEASLSYVTTVLDRVLQLFRAGRITQKQAREMAVKMGLFGEGQTEVTDEEIGLLVEDVLVKAKDDLDPDLADKVVTEILSDAAFLASEIGDGSLVKQLMAGLEEGTVSNVEANLLIVGEAISPAKKPTQRTPDLLEGLVPPRTSDINQYVLSDMIIQNFVNGVLSGTSSDIAVGSSSQSTSQAPPTSSTLSETVVNTFVKKMLNSALEGLPSSPSTNEPDSIIQFVSGIIDMSHSFTGTQSQSNIAKMADEITEKISALSLEETKINTTKVTDSCPAIVTPTATNDGTEPHGLTTSQQNLIQNAESLHQHTHLSDTDESSEEEALPADYVDIHPVFKGEEILIEHDHAVATLGAISVKHFVPGSHLMHNEAIQRNSFSSLIRPDLSTLKSLHNKSLSQVKDKLEHVYQRSQMTIAKKEAELETLSDDENDDGENASTGESEAEVVLATDNLDDVKADTTVPAPAPVDSGSRSKIPIGPTKRKSNERTASKKLSKEKTPDKTVSKSSNKEVVTTSESKKSATASSTGKSVDGNKRRSLTENKPNRTSITGGKSASKLRRSKADVTLKKSLEREANEASRSTSDAGGPVYVKSVRSVDGTFSSKVKIRSTKSTDDTTAEQKASDVLSISASKAIIMENENVE